MNDKAARMANTCTSLKATAPEMPVPSRHFCLAKLKSGYLPRRAVVLYVLDTSLLLAGRDPPRDGTWATTPEAAAEVSPGGRDARRFEDWRSLGLEIRSGGPAALDAVADAAMAAGNLGRLSEADQSLLALAKELGAVLVTDDYTMQDIAQRLDIHFLGVNQDGITGSKQWQPRCTGCGRWFEAPQKRDECPICGSPVKDRVRNA